MTLVPFPSFEQLPSTISGDEVHVWSIRLDLTADELSECAEVLSDDERLSAMGFLLGRARDQFVATRSAVRSLLGRYLNVAPRALKLRAEFDGRPFVASSEHLKFSVSHAHHLALLAVAYGREVGVDVECPTSSRCNVDQALRMLADTETAALSALPAAERRAAFFSCWTCKEAYAKATGRGRRMKPRSFSVSLRQPALLHVDGMPEEAGRWRLESLRPAPGYVGAVCVEGRDWALKCWRWR